MCVWLRGSVTIARDVCLSSFDGCWLAHRMLLLQDISLVSPVHLKRKNRAYPFFAAAVLMTCIGLEHCHTFDQTPLTSSKIRGPHRIAPIVGFEEPTFSEWRVGLVYCLIILASPGVLRMCHSRYHSGLLLCLKCTNFSFKHYAAPQPILETGCMGGTM